MQAEMTAWLRTLYATALDILPIVAVILAFQLLVLRRPLPQWRRQLAGVLMVTVGLAAFLQGLHLAVFPLGEAMARQLTDPAFIQAAAPGGEPRWEDYLWVYLFAATVGFASSMAEPTVIAVALKVRHVSGGTVSVWGLRAVIALGVAVGLAVGAWRLVAGVPLAWLMVPGYLLLLLQTWRAPRLIVPIAYDAGGVTTSVVTVPLVTALGLGLAGTLPGRSPLVEGFGLVAFASLFPIAAVLAYGQIAEWRARRVARGGGEADPDGS